jgi:Raf kinase inhibitor-like YbhB/YbcL family protein
MKVKLVLLLLASALLCACASRNESGQGTRANANGPGQNVNPNVNQSANTGEQKAKMRLSSSAFRNEGTIPKAYTCDGANVSPPLAWEDVPEKARSLALIADDPDAPAKTWVHWVVFNLLATMKGLPENVPAQGMIAGRGVQGTNDFRKVGYGGPCPPVGTHRYFFKLYALDTELALDSSTTKDALLKAMEGHILAEGQLMGKYSRQ